VLIETLEPGRVFASHNADKVFNPASLIKLATSLVALKKLGPDFRFQIRVYASGQVDPQGKLQGELSFMGGDPTFGDIGANMMFKELNEHSIREAAAINVSPDFCFNFSDSPEESAKRMAKAFRLEKTPTGVTSEPSGTLLFAFYSHPLREILLYMNAHSSNFVAERIGAQIGGAAGVYQFLVDDLKLPPEQLSLATVTGREQNQMTARALLTVLRALITEARNRGLEPSDLLPVASEDTGTLRRRFAGTGLEGAVLGKTGTLTPEVDGGMASLAGLIFTEDAGAVAFVLLDQGSRISESRELEDRLLEEIIKSKARPHSLGLTKRDLLSTSSMRIERLGTPTRAVGAATR
jgi:D-alanyl-D-alanine carboxypeptidase/D-alanyl-D-alanine-endopeptidase (penicillin-binding protein 4)